MKSAQEVLEDLEASFSPAIDSALVHAMAFDYDLENESEVLKLTAMLRQLAERAEDERLNTTISCDLQGAGLDGAQDMPGGHAVEALLDDQLRTLQLQEPYSNVDSPKIQISTEDDPQTMLADFRAMFPQLKEFDITHILKRSKYDYNAALENLLNVAFLENEGQLAGEPRIARGVDGFIDESSLNTPETQPSHKRKGRKPNVRRRSNSTPAKSKSANWQAESCQKPTSRWDRAREEIDFVCVRASVPRKQVTSLYNSHGASLPQTIAALCLSDIENPYATEVSEKRLEDAALNLLSAVPSLSTAQARALVKTSYPSTASARELATALGSGEESHDLTPKYRRRSISPESMNDGLTTSPFPGTSSSPAQLRAIRADAFSKASAAYRKAKSKPLMGGAAAYYSSLGREAHSAIQNSQLASARALVQQQSRPGELDLHGIRVREALIVVQEHVSQWWMDSEQEWARGGKARNSQLRIIVGKGHHSEQGRARIGPAVSKMLVGQGWKTEVGSGEISVVGRVRRS